MYRWSWIAVLTCALIGPVKSVVPADSPQPPETSVGESGRATAPKLGQIQELLEAARHLEAAGEVELALQARRKAGQLLMEESARLAQEQRRYESLSNELDPKPIIVQAIIAETQHLSRDELIRVIQQAGGVPLDSESFDGLSGHIEAVLAPSSDGTDLLRSLNVGDNQLSILSRPQVMTLDGNPAEIQIGETRRIIRGVHLTERNAVVPEYADDNAGLQMSITPTLTSRNCVQVDLYIEQSRFMEEGTPIFVDPASGKTMTSPVKDITFAQTTTRVPDGRVLFLALDRQTSTGNTASDGAATRPMLLLMLQPKTTRE